MRIVLGLAAATALFATAASAETRPLSGFDSISASGRVEVEIVIGSQYSVEVTGPRVERVVTRVQGGELVIETRRHSGWGASGRDWHVRVTLPRLEGLDVSAGAEVNAREVNADRFHLDVSSGANVTVDGSCQVLTLDVSSGANLRAGGFRCGEVRADASSGANAAVYAARAISVDASSGASIRWSGEAQMRHVDISSGASARRTN
jgi:hypothetical protein